MILYFFPLIGFFLSFPSIIETNVNIELINEQLIIFRQSAKDYNQMYTELYYQVDSAVQIRFKPGENNILMEQLEEKLKYLSERIEKFEKLTEKAPKSIKDIFKEVKTGLLVNFAISLVETGLMIDGLRRTCDIIKKSEEFRQSNILQETTIKIVERLDKANEYFQKADNELYKTELQWDISIEANLLTKIDLDLTLAQVQCERAQDVLKDVLRNIQERQQSLSSNQNFHLSGFSASAIRTLYTIYESIVNPITSLTNIRDIIFSLNGAMHLANSIGHAHGYYWTKGEIQNLEIYQHKFDKLETLIKYSSRKINEGFVILKKLNEQN